MELKSEIIKKLKSLGLFILKTATIYYIFRSLGELYFLSILAYKLFKNGTLFSSFSELPFIVGYYVANIYVAYHLANLIVFIFKVENEQLEQ